MARKSFHLNGGAPARITLNRAAAATPPITWAMMYGIAFSALQRPAATSPQVTAGLKWPPEIEPTAYAIASTDKPTAKATATSPADGAENSAAPHTALTSMNVPMNSAPNSRTILASLVLNVIAAP